MLALLQTLLAAAVLASAHPHNNEDHAHTARSPLPGNWYHAEDHPAHALFRRGDAVVDAAVGSPAWSASFPATIADVDKVPKAWTAALQAAIAAGKIPNIPQSTPDSTGYPTYPGLDPQGKEVCSATYKCRNPGDLWDAPDGVFGVTFDDGPLPTSDALYTYLKAEHIPATHFMIGINVLNNQRQFKTAFEELQNDIAGHTWTHPYMTTLTNEQVLGELGYTSLIISQLTGGRLPKYWRPPYGDSDNRVRAIAKEIFGMDTILWNHDTEDWSLTTGGTTPEQVHKDMASWFAGPKSPGIMILEHELSTLSVNAFIDGYPLAKAAGWTPRAVSQFHQGDSPYQNAAGNTGDVTSAPLLANGGGSNLQTSASTTTGAASTTNATATASQSATKTGVPSLVPGVTSSSPAKIAQSSASAIAAQSGAASLSSPRLPALFFTFAAALFIFVSM